MDGLPKRPPSAGLPVSLLDAVARSREPTTEVVAWLEQGGQVDARCAEQGSATLLMAAANNGQTLLVRLLLRRNASLDLQDIDGGTALMCAAYGGHTATVQALLEAGADASLYDDCGRTALQWAELYKLESTAALLRRYDDSEPSAAPADADGTKLAGHLRSLYGPSRLAECCGRCLRWS